MSEFPTSGVVLEHELTRLATFAGRLVHAQSCFVYLPSDHGRGHSGRSERVSGPSTKITQAPSAEISVPSGGITSRRYESLELRAHFSTIESIQTDARVPADTGLIGWIVKQQRPLHISPFENDSRVLGAYVERVEIRSFIGVPLIVGGANDADPEDPMVGALVCDHAREMAFSRAHGQALQEVAHQVSLLLRLVGQGAKSSELSWRNFLSKGEQLCGALGFESLAILRLGSSSFSELERELGTARALELDEQTYRLIGQALPPHFPVTRLPNGDIIVLVDMMMASFFENKIRQLIERIAGAGKRVEFQSSITPTKVVKVGKNPNFSKAIQSAVGESSRRRLQAGKAESSPAGYAVGDGVSRPIR